MLCFKFYIYFNKPTFVKKNHFLKLDLSLLWTNDDSSLNYFVQDFILSMTDVSNRLIFFIQMIKLKPTCQLSNNVKNPIHSHTHCPLHFPDVHLFFSALEMCSILIFEDTKLIFWARTMIFSTHLHANSFPYTILRLMSVLGT